MVCWKLESDFCLFSSSAGNMKFDIFGAANMSLAAVKIVSQTQMHIYKSGNLHDTASSFQEQLNYGVLLVPENFGPKLKLNFRVVLVSLPDSILRLYTVNSALSTVTSLHHTSCG